jgi:hypothetical protein
MSFRALTRRDHGQPGFLKLMDLSFAEVYKEWWNDIDNDLVSMFILIQPTLIQILVNKNSLIKLGMG